MPKVIKKNDRSAPARSDSTPASPEAETPPRPKLVFHCQQAQGSPTGVISGFTNVKELYQKIAECYDLKPAEILFCTLNTHKIDMSQLLGGQLGLDDFIFAHVKGQPKEITDLEKTEDALGLTITDNGAGLAFIKGIKEGSIISKVQGISVGDHIEKINGTSVVGCRHYEVAKILKGIVKGASFTLRLVEPKKSGFNEISGKRQGGRNSTISSGTKTLRLRAKGPATVDDLPDDIVTVAIDKINALLEGFLGISDAELAQSIWETGTEAKNPSEFAQALANSDLQEFGFTEAFTFDLWGAISDAKQGRLKKAKEFSEAF